MDDSVCGRETSRLRHTPMVEIEALALWDASQFESDMSLYDTLLTWNPMDLIDSHLYDQLGVFPQYETISSSDTDNSSKIDQYTRTDRAHNESLWNMALEAAAADVRSVPSDIHLPQSLKSTQRISKDKMRGAPQNSPTGVKKSSSPYKQKARQYRFSMRDASAASLWAAWQSTSFTRRESTTLEVFKASRRQSS